MTNFNPNGPSKNNDEEVDEIIDEIFIFDSFDNYPTLEVMKTLKITAKRMHCQEDIDLLLNLANMLSKMYDRK